jgi:tagatose 1,6-diphosphate aldolase GatY/KbaY
MRAQLDVIAGAALARHAAVPAFTCYDFTTAVAVVEAAEAADAAVILLVAPKTMASASGQRLVRALRALADSATVPVSIQLDHSSDLGLILTGVEAGVDSVLVDGSALAYEENIRLVRSAREAIGDPRIVLEAELGGLAGDEDKAFAMEAAELTDPGLVADFVRRSGARLLAVAVGNVHGKYASEPNLRWDVLRDIAAQSTVPLVLHGASGLPATDLAAAPSVGVGKINFNTELRTGVLSAVQREIDARRDDGEDLLGLLVAWQDAARTFARASLATLSGQTSAG